MNSSNTRMRGVAIVAALIFGSVLLAACGSSDRPTTTTTTTTTVVTTTIGTTTSTTPPSTVPDATITAWVTPGADAITYDEAEILTGQAAHDAAVQAGIITEDEDLPNDMFVADAGLPSVTVPVASDVVIDMISAVQPDQTVTITYADLQALYDGTSDRTDIYGVVPETPLLMTVTVSGGEVTMLEAVYQP